MTHQILQTKNSLHKKLIHTFNFSFFLKLSLLTLLIAPIAFFFFEPLTAFAETTTLRNPIRIENGTNPRVFIGTMIRILIAFSGTVALAMFVYGGILFLVAGGNETQLAKAKKVLVYAILGIIVIAAAYVATNTIIQTVLTGNPLSAGVGEDSGN